MPFDESCIRPATVDDARPIAEVHVASWKRTYHAILPASVLEDASADKWETSWKERLAVARADAITLVACGAAGEVIGFASGGAERTGSLGCDGELYAIYLLEAARGQGLGTVLVRRIAGQLQSMGLSSMAVWVLDLNPYKKFYEALGGAVIGEKTMQRGGESFVALAYGWKDLGRLQRTKI